jgi:hypothetical protein
LIHLNLKRHKIKKKLSAALPQGLRKEETKKKPNARDKPSAQSKKQNTSPSFFWEGGRGEGWEGFRVVASAFEPFFSPPSSPSCGWRIRFILDICPNTACVLIAVCVKRRKPDDLTKRAATCAGYQPSRVWRTRQPFAASVVWAGVTSSMGKIADDGKRHAQFAGDAGRGEGTRI